MTSNQVLYHKNFTGMLVDFDGNERHFIDGAYGRPGDLPSVVWADGSRFWYKENPKRGGMCQPAAIPHREGGLPASIKANGDKYYYIDGKLSREDGPAVELSNGTRKWFTKGVFDRSELPAPSNQDIVRPNFELSFSPS